MKIHQNPLEVAVNYKFRNYTKIKSELLILILIITDTPQTASVFLMLISEDADLYLYQSAHCLVLTDLWALRSVTHCVVSPSADAGLKLQKNVSRLCVYLMEIATTNLAL